MLISGPPAKVEKPPLKLAKNAKLNYNSGECAILLSAGALDEGLHNTNPHILNMMKREVETQVRTEQ